MKHVVSVFVVVLIITHLCYPAPSGYLTYSVLDGPPKVYEMQVNGSTQHVVHSGGYVVQGLDAPPFLGNTQVMYEEAGQPEKDGIKLLNRTGDVAIVVSSVDVTNPVEPGISFDSMRVAYVSHNVGSFAEDILHVAQITGEDDAIIYTTPAGKNCDIFCPRFTADGSFLVFIQFDTTTNTREIYRIPVSGGVPQKLEGLPAHIRELSLSPDGKLLACMLKTNSVKSLIISRADGTDMSLVPLGGDSAYRPVFSPDSAYVAAFSQNGINIINAKTFAVTRRINFNHSGGYGLCWHLGARKSTGRIDKLKISEKSVSIKTAKLIPSAVPSNGLVLVDGVSLRFDDPSLWINKKDKKFMYSDKALKYKAKTVVKNGKGSVAAKKLELIEGTDYRPETQIAVGVNMGDESIAENIILEKKGKYKAPK